MKVLITVSFFAMAVAHLVDLSVFRYVPIIAAIVLTFIAGRRVYLTNYWWYNVGGATILLSSALPSILYGDSLSYAYVVFGVLNFFLYPLFEKIELTNTHLAMIFVGLSMTIVPLGFGKKVISIYQNPNNYSAVVFSTLYFGMLLFRNRMVAQIGVLAVFTVLIFLGASRSMLGAIGVFALLYFGQRWVLHTVFRKLLVAVFVVFAFGYYTLITNDQFKLMEAIQNNTIGDKKDRGLSHRDDLYYYSLDLVDKQPEGYGLGMSKQALKPYYGEKISPHSTYLKVLVEGGWVALAGLLILMLGFLLTSQSPLASSFIFALLVRGFFESATPFSISLVSGMLIIPMFLNERSIGITHRLVLKPSDGK
jgi:hypothetical protein